MFIVIFLQLIISHGDSTKLLTISLRTRQPKSINFFPGGTVYLWSLVCLTDPIHRQTQSDDPITSHRKPVKRNNKITCLFDFIGPLHWFPEATNWIMELSRKSMPGLKCLKGTSLKCIQPDQQPQVHTARLTASASLTDLARPESLAVQVEWACSLTTSANQARMRHGQEPPPSPWMQRAQ